MERTHVAKEDHGSTIELHAVDQKDHRRHKPLGFWYEVDGDWRRWCRDEDFADPDGPLYRVMLNGERILTIRSDDGLRAFSAEYGKPERGYTYEVDWERVAEDWDGIEIAPYLWSMRLDIEISWYYGWDCASGVIWRPKGVRVSRLEDDE